MIESILFIIGVSYSGAFISILAIIKWIEICQNKEFSNQLNFNKSYSNVLKTKMERKYAIMQELSQVHLETRE